MGSCESILDERSRDRILGFVRWSQDSFEFCFTQNLRRVIKYGCLVVRGTTFPFVHCSLWCIHGCFPGPTPYILRDRHAVVVFVRNETGDWLIGDPALGQTTWINEELQSRFTGEARYSQASQEIRIAGQVASPQLFAPSACRLIQHCHWEVRPVPALRNLFDIPD